MRVLDTDELEAAQRLIASADLVTPMAIRTAVQLHLFDHLGEEPLSVAELATRTGSLERVLSALLEHLAHEELVVHLDDGRYAVGPLGRPLRPGSKLGVRELLDPEHVVGQQELALVDLVHTVRTGQPAAQAGGDRTLWQRLDDLASADADKLTAFDWEEPGFDAEALLADPLWRDATSVLDAGGCTGSMLLALLERHPHLRGELVDLDRLAAHARSRFRRRGLDDRATATGGSFFDPLPTGHDVVLLSAILADWEDEDAVLILRRCLQAAGPTGTLVVAEVHMTTDAAPPEHRSAAALRLEAGMTRPDRSAEDVVALVRRAGGRVLRTAQTGTRSVTVARAGGGA